MIELQSFCNLNNIIPDSQYGFRHGLSATHAIHKLLSDTNVLVDKSQLVAAALLDVEKAFDSVWINGLLHKLQKKRFPPWLLHLIWDMISNKSFVTRDSVSTSSIEFRIVEGLQQGTVNSPVLFNIFVSDLANLFNFNKTGYPTLLMFADDIIVYLADNRAIPLRDNLEATVDKIASYLAAWNLRINPSKCETVLFRKPVDMLSSRTKAGSKNFNITTLVPGTNERIPIPHKKVVRYLGVVIDYLLRGNHHIDAQLEKANRAFLANSRLFRNKYLSPKAKTILYMLLIRPIITYAAPVWWNFNHTTGEKMRVLERKCLRSCLGMYRSRSSEWQHYISNRELYEAADIPRIDVFTLELTRAYYSKLPLIDNDSIKEVTICDDRAAPRQLTTGYLPPQVFTYCDKLGLVQNANNVPILYQWRRNKADKRIALSHDDCIYNRSRFAFSTKLPAKDLYNFGRLDFTKYWWLDSTSTHMEELQARRISWLTTK